MLMDIKTFKDIGAQIEQIARELNTDYIDAVLHYCEKNNIEVDFVGEVIAKNPTLKAKIEIEAENLNFIKKTSRLPL